MRARRAEPRVIRDRQRVTRGHEGVEVQAHRRESRRVSRRGAHVGCADGVVSDHEQAARRGGVRGHNEAGLHRWRRPCYDVGNSTSRAGCERACRLLTGHDRSRRCRGVGLAQVSIEGADRLHGRRAGGALGRFVAVRAEVACAGVTGGPGARIGASCAARGHDAEQ